jgi:hypothetical protein
MTDLIKKVYQLISLPRTSDLWIEEYFLNTGNIWMERRFDVAT